MITQIDERTTALMVERPTPTVPPVVLRSLVTRNAADDQSEEQRLDDAADDVFVCNAVPDRIDEDVQVLIEDVRGDRAAADDSKDVGRDG